MLLPDIQQIKLLRKYIKVKVIDDNVTFRGHSLERQHVHDLIKWTIESGESHSALIIGPRGCGKSTLINSVLHDLSEKLDIANDAIIIKLSGFLHHDEKVALKAITAQMKLDNAVGDRVFGTFAENLAFLLSCLQSGADRRCKSMVFILDEFDMFCHVGRTQTLLYNLFDVTHTKQAPMCVIGLTSRLDVMELLEKRVKSRFSHRHIFLFPNEDTNSKIQRTPCEVYVDLFKVLLSVPTHICNNSQQTPKRKKQNVTGHKKRLTDNKMEVDDLIDSTPREIFSKRSIDFEQFKEFDRNFLENWNGHVRDLSENPTVVDAFEKFCYYTINEQIFRNVLFQIISKLSPKKPIVEVSDICSIIDNTVSAEHRISQLQSLSILELSLVIAMKHGLDIFDGKPMNFEMVLHRYTKFAIDNSSAQTVPKPVILKAFEHLQALEIIVPVKSSESAFGHNQTTASKVQKEYQLYTLAVPVEDIQEAVKGFKALPTEIGHWFYNSII